MTEIFGDLSTAELEDQIFEVYSVKEADLTPEERKQDYAYPWFQPSGCPTFARHFDNQRNSSFNVRKLKLSFRSRGIVKRGSGTIPVVLNALATESKWAPYPFAALNWGNRFLALYDEFQFNASHPMIASILKTGLALKTHRLEQAPKNIRLWLIPHLNSFNDGMTDSVVEWVEYVVRGQCYYYYYYYISITTITILPLLLRHYYHHYYYYYLFLFFNFYLLLLLLLPLLLLSLLRGYKDWDEAKERLRKDDAPQNQNLTYFRDKQCEVFMKAVPESLAPKLKQWTLLNQLMQFEKILGYSQWLECQEKVSTIPSGDPAAGTIVVSDALSIVSGDGKRRRGRPAIQKKSKDK